MITTPRPTFAQALIELAPTETVEWLTEDSVILGALIFSNLEIVSETAVSVSVGLTSNNFTKFTLVFELDERLRWHAYNADPEDSFPSFSDGVFGVCPDTLGDLLSRTLEIWEQGR